MDIAHNNAAQVTPFERLVLDHSTWLDFQISVAKEAVSRLEDAALELKKGKDRYEKRVHNMRIAFRRWYSIWSVLRHEGFESESYKAELGRKFKEAYKLLGATRDWDVTLNHGEKMGVPEEILAKWRLEYDRVAAQSKSKLKRLDLNKLIKKLHCYIDKLAIDLASHADLNPNHNVIARSCIDMYLLKREAKTRELASAAKTLKDLHALRLSIKGWRYLLVEFYGYTAERLVGAQQLLGQIIDLERLHKLIAAEEGTLARECSEKVALKQSELIGQVDALKELLPYGARTNKDLDPALVGERF